MEVLSRWKGTIAPSAIVSVRLGITSSGSSSICTPRPVQVGQAPWGLLKEKLRGSISPTEYGGWLGLGQAKCSLKVSSGAGGVALARLRGEEQDALTEAQRLLDGVGDALARGVGVVGVHGVVARGGELGDDEAVDDHVDVVPLVAVEVELLVDVANLAVDADADEAGALDGLEDLLVLAAAVADDRREQHGAGAGRLGEDRVDDLLDGLAADDLPAVRAVRLAGAREEQPQVVVDLGDGGDRGAGVLRDALLIDGDGGGEAVDVVDIGLLHEAEELAGVGGQRFDITALALGVDRVEGE